MRISETEIINDVLITSAKELEDRITEFLNRTFVHGITREEIMLTDGWILKLEHINYGKDSYSDSVILFRSEWQHENISVTISYEDRIRKIPSIARTMIDTIKNATTKDGYNAFKTFEKSAYMNGITGSHEIFV